MSFDGLIASNLLYRAPYHAPEPVQMLTDGDIEFPAESFAGKPLKTSNLAVDERFAERTRIAQELHDTLLQEFLAASMQLHVAVDRLPADYSDRQQFESVIRLVDHAIEDGRCALQGLRSPNGRTSTLGEAFARVPSDLGFASADGFRVVVLGGEKQLRAGLLDEVYRIGREAIVNACLHSQAKAIEAEIEYRPTELRVAVRDNGRGIGPQDLQWGRIGHWGLQGMRERAESIGARFRLWSGAALGTEVELRVPGQIAFQQLEPAPRGN
jgi:signal transduction histidine kinase